VTKFLLDANISVQTADFLRESFGFDVVALQASHQATLRDEEVVALARAQTRVIITFDQDLGEIFYQRERGKFGVIVLQLSDQTVESVNQNLEKFFTTDVAHIDLDTSLVVLEADRVRVVPAQ
jgi:predicted nuclease of predicted toxin-antitoxin system